MTQAATTPAEASFREGFVEADGFRIRYLEAGSGAPLVYLHGGGGLHLSEAHRLLSQSFHVVAFEMPGFGQSEENTRSASMAELAMTMAQAAAKVGLDSYSLLGTSFGGKAALWLAVQAPERVAALVLESAAAIRPEGAAPPPNSPEELARRLYAHPERVAARPSVDAETRAKGRRLVSRLMGPARDEDLERRMRDLEVPTLVLFGTEDTLLSPDMGHLYMKILPNCHLVFVYDAGHEIGAERPEAFVEPVVDFLDRREAFVISEKDTVLYP